jgi:hypothetical protein
MKMKLKSAIAVFGSSVFLAAAPAPAAPIGADVIQNAHSHQASPLTEVRYRGRHWRHRHYYRRHHHDDDAGAVAAGAIFGLAAGAILGNAAAGNNAVAYCSRRFRSYDPASGTYLGYDGYRHSCP